MTYPAIPMQRLLLDATSTLYTGYMTGIQRVVLSLEEELKVRCAQKGIVFETLYFNGKYYQICTPHLREALKARRRVAKIVKKPIKTALLAAQLPFLFLLRLLAIAWQPVLALAPEEWKRWVRGRTFLRLFSRLTSVFRHYLKDSLKSALFIRDIGHVLLPLIKSSNRWRPQPGDVLFMADATWNYSPWAEVARARQIGVTAHALVYDLLPLKYPDFFSPILSAAFRSWWDICSKEVSTYLCISEAVRQDVAKRFAQHDDLPPRAVVFPLGFDFAEQPALMPPAPPLEGVNWQTDRIFLAVGTLEPRKNHAYILDAFDHVWAESLQEKLIIVGRRGWVCDSIVARIESHPLYKKNLFWLDGCSDAELSAFYAGADALIAASIDEGYGLPLIEAAAKGIPTLASDIPVFREVAAPESRFFGLSDPKSLAHLVRSTTKAPNPKVPAPAQSFPSWSDSARVVFLHLRYAARAAQTGDL